MTDIPHLDALRVMLQGWDPERADFFCQAAVAADAAHTETTRAACREAVILTLCDDPATAMIVLRTAIGELLA